MTIRFSFPLTALLLMICSLVNAASSAQVTEAAPPEANPPVQLHDETFLDWSTNCPKISIATEESVFIPTPREQVSLSCGACSMPACRGMNIGDTCGIINGTVVHCVLVSFCGSGPGTGRFCDCSTPVD
jgi:hypothetical protein